MSRTTEPQTATQGSLAPSHRPPEPALTPRQLEALDIVWEYQLTDSWSEIAERVGVDRSTLLRWRKQPEFQRALTQHSRAQLRDYLPTAYQALVRKLSTGDVPAIKLYLELTGEYQAAGLRDLLGAWLQALSIAGKPAIRRLVAELERAQAEALGSELGEAVEAEAHVLEEEGGSRGLDV